MSKALIIVDIQNDFLPGGSLEVPSGNEIIDWINEILPQYELIAVTQDWHPEGHISFASSHSGKRPFDKTEVHGEPQVLWPDHCVQGSPGAGFPGSLDLRPVAAIFRKGMDPEVDSYSGFFDLGRRQTTGLADWLKGMGVREVHICGLAAEICVAYTARDAVEQGFETSILEHGTRYLDEEAYEKCKADLKEDGVRFIS